MNWLRRLFNTFRPSSLRLDIDREISFHLAERVDELRAKGLSDSEAKRRARLQFGNPVPQAERTDDTAGALRFEMLSEGKRQAGATTRLPKGRRLHWGRRGSRPR